MRSCFRILCFAIAAAGALGASSANADDNQAQWTGFYAGVNAGFARSNDPLDLPAFEDKNSSTGTPKYTGNGGELPGSKPGHDLLDHNQFLTGMENEIDKALPFAKGK
jgi:hypothetical protein